MKTSENKGRVLIFSSREICYLSANFFANQLGAAFEELGYDADVCEFSAEADLDETLKPYLGRHYEVIADFNSMLPRMVLEDGTPYLDRLDGPFFDYILDHPLFHHTGLTSGVRNLHALVLDEAQERYVRRYYPKVGRVSTLPLAATRSLVTAEKEAECRILFTGTYDSPDEVYKVVQAAPEPLRSTMKRLVEMRAADPLLPMEEAFAQELKAQETEMAPEQFALYMNAMYAVDAYIRDYFRKQTLDALLAAELPVTVMGSGWEKYSHPKERCLKREPEVVFGLSFERIARAHVLLNIAPIFNRGMHDRIPAGMANRAVVLTDRNPYLERHFTDGGELVFYSLTDMTTVVDAAERLWKDPALREEIAARAYREYEEHHTWKRRAEELLRLAGA